MKKLFILIFAFFVGCIGFSSASSFTIPFDDNNVMNIDA
jgi:hypothetical protein